MAFIKRIENALRASADEGQTMAEYGLILTGVALVVMATTLLLGGAIGAALQTVIDAL